MKLSLMKINLILARKHMVRSSLRKCGVSAHTLTRLWNGFEANPATIGRIATALGVDPVDIIETEELL